MVDVKMYTREGCRGGRENFKWDQLKDQDFKDREQYLGVSAKVGLMAKFGRYYVHDWYAKKRDTAESIESEKQTVQQYEEELMQEALGLKPKKLLLAKKQLSEEELKEFLKPESEKRGDKGGRELMGPQNKMMTDSSGQEVAPEELFSDARINGLGFAAHRNAKLEKYKADVLGTEAKLEGIKGEVKLEVKSEIKNEMMSDTECLRLGDGASSSSSSFKKEEPGLKPEIGLKPEEPKEEVKDEPAEASGMKRRLDDEDEDDRRKKGKAEKKSKKKKKEGKKAEKKAKKKVKKALKKEKKAAKLAAKLTGSRKPASPSSDSSGSSSS
jgi:hypothetical protein